MRFDDKVVILTGVGRQGQVGEQIAHSFANAGATIVAIDRTPDGVMARAAELRAAGQRAEGHPCDLTDERQLAALVADVGERHGGRADALVHIAGGFSPSGPVAESDYSVWQRQFAINLTSAYLTTRAFLPLLRAARGAIVYFSAAAALPGARVARLSAYAAAKSGVVVLMRAIAEEERDHGIRANALAPTAIRTATNTASMGDGVRYVERESVAQAVLFLCSPAAGGITGQTMAMS